MFKIIKKENLAPNIFLMDVEAPRIAKYALPGQFLIVRVDEEGERIPLTICDYDSEKGIVQIVFQVIGGDTYRMSHLEVGDSFADMVGPLGKPSDLTELPIEELKKMKICFIAGGVGTGGLRPGEKLRRSGGLSRRQTRKRPDRHRFQGTAGLRLPGSRAPVSPSAAHP